MVFISNSLGTPVFELRFAKSGGGGAPWDIVTVDSTGNVGARIRYPL